MSILATANYITQILIARLPGELKMLLLTRRSGESIIINDDISIVVMDCGNHSVNIGISAPADVKIFRKEVYERIKFQEKMGSNNDFSSDDNSERGRCD